MKIPGAPTGVSLALGGVKSWQMDGSILRLVMGNAFLGEGLVSNKDWLLEHLKNWLSEISDISLDVDGMEEEFLKDWDLQKKVWLEVFRGREV